MSHLPIQDSVPGKHLSLQWTQSLPLRHLRDRTWEARENLAEEPQACMLTRAEKAEKGALWEHLALRPCQSLLGLCVPPLA